MAGISVNVMTNLLRSLGHTRQCQNEPGFFFCLIIGLLVVADAILLNFIFKITLSTAYKKHLYV